MSYMTNCNLSSFHENKSLPFNLYDDIEATKTKIDSKSLYNFESLYLDIILVNNIEIIKYLIFKGVDINYKDEVGNTFLFYSKSIEITNFYLENGLDINHTNVYGNNVLHFSYINIQHFLFLIKKGIIITQKNRLDFLGLSKTIIDNPFYYYMRENIKDYLNTRDILNFLYEILNDDIGSIIYANPLKIYNGKFNIGKDDIKYFLHKIKSYKSIQSQKYKEIFISLII